jgi:exodeoxyribonuclease VII small subunit
MAKKKKSADEVSESFEDALEELDELTERLSHEPDSLGQLIDDYERGQKLIQYCTNQLDSARKRIEIIQAELSSDSKTESTDPSPDDNDDVRLF